MSLVVALATSLAAQNRPEPSVTARIEEARIPQGAQTVFHVTVENGSPDTDSIPKSMDVDGLEINHIGTNRNTEFINGVVKSRIQIFYGVSGNEPGKYNIPPVEISVDGRVYQTEPMTVEIYKLEGSAALSADRAYFMTLSPAKEEIYVNEVIPLELTLYARGTGSIRGISSLEIDGSDEFVIKNLRNSHRSDPVSIDGIPYTSVRLPALLFGLTPGEFEIGPAKVTAKVESSNSSFRIFPMHRDREVHSNSATLTVKPLPEQGKPSNFEGAVGKFDLTVDASPIDLRVGDPISVDIRITGQGNFDSVTSPNLPESEGWKSYKANRVETDEASEGLTGSVAFNQVVIPMEEHDQLPAIELAYFNPETAEYVVKSSLPIPLSIAPDPLAGMAARPAGSFSEGAGVPVEQLNDILFIHTHRPSWTSLTASVWQRPVYRWVNILALLVFLGLLAEWGRRAYLRRKNRQPAGEKLTFSDLRDKLSHDRISRSLFYKLVLGYLEQNGGLREKVLAQLPDDTRSRLDSLRAQGHHFLYSGGSSQQNQPVTRDERDATLQALAQVEGITEKTA